MTLGMVVVCGAIEVVLVLTIRPMQNHHGRDIAVKFFGILSCILISVALFPQYYEIYKLKAVIGISLTFMAIDMLGGLLNDLSLVFAERFDVLAALSYTLVIVSVFTPSLVLEQRPNQENRYWMLSSSYVRPLSSSLIGGEDAVENRHQLASWQVVVTARLGRVGPRMLSTAN